jgi:hypothetical protein
MLLPTKYYGFVTDSSHIDAVCRTICPFIAAVRSGGTRNPRGTHFALVLLRLPWSRTPYPFALFDAALPAVGRRAVEDTDLAVQMAAAMGLASATRGGALQSEVVRGALRGVGEREEEGRTRTAAALTATGAASSSARRPPPSPATRVPRRQRRTRRPRRSVTSRSGRSTPSPPTPSRWRDPAALHGLLRIVCFHTLHGVPVPRAAQGA